MSNIISIESIKIAGPIFGVLGLISAWFIYSAILKKPSGNDRMQEIALAIRTGALAFLSQQFKVLSIFIVVVTVLISIFLGWQTGLCYVIGAGSSLIAGLMGMKSATAANVRTAQAAADKNPGDALQISFNGGAVMGMAIASLGVLGLGILFIFFGTPAEFKYIIGFGMGASSVALFARIGGGIYTKAADVGADLVGKVEAGIPEDDPRNPGVIADNVGDNVGDVAGMGADIYESYVTCLIGAIALAVTANADFIAKHVPLFADNIGQAKLWLMINPIAIGILGLISSYIAIKMVGLLKNSDPEKVIRQSSLIASGILLAFAFVYSLLVPLDFNFFWCIVAGTACGVAIGIITEYFTSSKPVYVIVEGAKTGPATCIINGMAVGLNSCILPILIMAGTAFLSAEIASFYGVALAGVGMLATVGMTMTIDAFGPIADNAGGISEMSELGPETRAITDRLDVLGNTTAAIGKGFAIGSAGVAALSIFGAFVEDVIAHAQINNLQIPNFDITNSSLIVGAFIGSILPAVVTSCTMRAVGRAAGLMVSEIRRQFREIPGLLEGKPGAKPDVQKCVAISTKAAISEMMLPGLIAIVTPLLTGFILGPSALGGLLLGTTITGVLFGMFMSNTGGAWDNAKKFIEQGKVEGEKKGSAAHKAAVVGDTVGDPFKDTSGPALNILIKMVSMLALLIAPLL